MNMEHESLLKELDVLPQNSPNMQEDCSKSFASSISVKLPP
jgi:hypothetical protein